MPQAFRRQMTFRRSLRRGARALLVALAVVSLAATASAQDRRTLDPDEGRSAIEGRVVGYEGKLPLVVDIVSKVDGQEAPPTRIPVDRNGLFRVADIQPGHYRFVVAEATDGEAAKTEMDRKVGEGVNRVTIAFPPPGEARLFEGGVRHAGGEGAAAFRFRLEPEDGDGKAIPVEGARGRFSVPMPPEGTWVIRSVVVDGERYPVQRSLEVLPQTHYTALTIDLPRLTKWELRVVDDRGEPIPNARAYRWSGKTPFEFGSGSWSVPSPEALRGEPATGDAAGVVKGATFGRVGGRTQGWAVVADGHAWATVRAAPKTRTPPARVVLAVGGQIRLRVERWDELEAAEVTVGLVDGPNAHGNEYLVAPRANGEVLVEGLLPGEYSIEVRRRSTSAWGRVYASAKTLVVAGKTGEVTVEAEPGPRRDRVARFGVVLHGAADWGRLTSVHLTGGERDNSEFDAEIELGAPDESGGVAFEVQDIAVGRYHALVEPIGWRGVIEVAELDGLLHVPLGKPATVRLRVVAADTGEGVPSPSGIWHAELSRLSSFTHRQIETEGHGPMLSFRCVASRVSVRVAAEGFLDATVRLDVESGAAVERTVKLPRAGGVQFRFVEKGGQLVRLPDTVVRLEHDGSSWAYRGTIRRDAGLPPAIYRMSVGRVPGYEPIPPRDIRVEAGKTLDVTIELVPVE